MQTSPTTARKKTLLFLIVVLAASTISYVFSLDGTFVLDDEFLIVDDPVAHGLSNAREAFGQPFLSEMFPDGAVYYRPLITLSFQLDYTCWGLDPFGYRLTNLIVFALSSLLVFFVARRLTKEPLAAFFASVIYSVLPTHAETVAWISGRTDLFSALFMLAAFLCFAMAVEKDCFNWKLSIAGSFFFALSLFSKEQGMMLPVLFAGYLFIYPTTRKSDIAKLALTIIVPAAIYIALRLSVVGTGTSMDIGYLLGERLLLTGLIYTLYIRMLFFPSEMVMVYDSLMVWAKRPAVAYLSFLVPATLIFLFIYMRKRNRTIAFAAFWIFFSLLPVSNIIPIAGPVPTERFSHLASVGSSILAGYLFYLLHMRLKTVKIRPLRALPAILFAWFSVYCAALTVSNSQVFASELNWARKVTASNPRFSILRLQAAYIYAEHGKMEKAEDEYVASIRAAGRLVEPANFLSLARHQRVMGKPYAALETLKKGSHTFPALAVFDYETGNIYASMDDLETAVDYYNLALKKQSDHPGAMRNLARAYYILEDYSASASLYEKLSKISPLLEKDSFRHAGALAKIGQTDESRKIYRKLSESENEKTASEATTRLQDLQGD